MTLWRDSHAKRFGVDEPLGRFSSMLTVHYYTYRSTDPGISHEDFLQEKSVSTVLRTGYDMSPSAEMIKAPVDALLGLPSELHLGSMTSCVTALTPLPGQTD